MSYIPTFTKDELKAMDKKEIINHFLALCKQQEEREVQGISERTTLMRMVSHFLGHMKRPNTNRTAKKGKPIRPSPSGRVDAVPRKAATPWPGAHSRGVGRDSCGPVAVASPGR